jgi:hypothetical protein
VGRASDIQIPNNPPHRPAASAHPLPARNTKAHSAKWGRSLIKRSAGLRARSRWVAHPTSEVQTIPSHRPAASSHPLPAQGTKAHSEKGQVADQTERGPPSPQQVGRASDIQIPNNPLSPLGRIVPPSPGPRHKSPFSEMGQVADQTERGPPSPQQVGRASEIRSPKQSPLTARLHRSTRAPIPRQRMSIRSDASCSCPQQDPTCQAA